MNKYILLLIGFVCVLCLPSCTEGVILEENYKIENAEWNRTERAVFEFEIKDSVSVYEIYLNFRHGGGYPYQNIYLFTRTISPSGLMAKDTANMLLANSRGRWMGKGIGDIFDYEFKFKEGFLFPETGTYRFEIEQAMRDLVIEEVTDIGVTVKKVEK